MPVTASRSSARCLTPGGSWRILVLDRDQEHTRRADPHRLRAAGATGPTPPEKRRQERNPAISAARTTFDSPLESGRPGWAQGRGSEADTWRARVAGRDCIVIRARGAFLGETDRPGGVFCTGERSTLAAAQEAIEAAARDFSSRAAPAPRPAAAPPSRPRPVLSDREIFLALSSARPAA